MPERDPAHLPVPARLSRWLEGAWDRKVSSRPDLDPAAIIAAATKKEGASPSEGGWSARLALLCAELEQTSNLNPLGRTIAFGQLVRILASRIRAEKLWSDRPEILERPISRPVAIVGQMRSGTTRVQRLLACEPQFAHTRLFESLEPVPYGPIARAPDRRALSAWSGTRLLKACNPALAAIHPTSPFAPEEEFGLHAFSLWGAQFEGQWLVPEFARHCEEADPTETYDEFANLLRTIGWTRGDGEDRRWLLKAPQFAQDLPALQRQFSDIAMIRLHRDPSAVVGSSASLAFQQARVQSDEVDPHAIGAEWLRKTKLREARMQAFFADHPDVPVIELDYDEVSCDWLTVVKRIYAFLDMEFGPSVKARMAKMMRQSTDHHGHRYSLGDFGIDAAELDQSFGSRAQPSVAGSSVSRKSSALAR